MSHPSSLPSTRLLVTDIAGSVLKRLSDQQPEVFAYCAFGHLGPARAVAPLLGFNSQHREPLTGVYLLGNGHRSFNPVLMRFVSADDLSPFGDGGINAYAYCQNDPINRTDPSGRMSLIHLISTRNGTSSYMFTTPTNMSGLTSVTMSSSRAHLSGTVSTLQPGTPDHSSFLTTRQPNSLSSANLQSASTHGASTVLAHPPQATPAPMYTQTSSHEADSSYRHAPPSEHSRSRSNSVKSTDSWDEWIPDQDALNVNRLASPTPENGDIRTSL